MGVNIEIDEDFDYAGRLMEIQAELDALNAEAAELSQTISENMKNLV